MKYQHFFGVLILSFINFSALNAHQWDWKKLFEQSQLKSHPLHSLTLERQQALLKKQQAKGAYIPTLEWTGKAAYTQSESTINIDHLDLNLFGQNFLLPEVNTGLNTNGWLGLSNLEASFLLYSGNRVTHLSKAAQASADAQLALSDKETQILLLELLTLMDQYALLLKSDSLIMTAETVLEENKKVAEKAFEYGIITAYEKEQVNLASGDLQVKKVAIQGKKSLILAKLSQLTGEQMEASEVKWPELHLISTHSSLSTVEVLRPELRALTHKIEAEQSLIQLQKTWWIPQLQAKAGLSYLGVHSMNIKGGNPLPLFNQPLDFRLKNAYVFPLWQVGVGFKWTLFDGLQGTKATKIATLEQQKTIHQKQEAEELIALEQQQYNIQLKNIQEQLLAYQTQAQYRYDALKIVEKEFKLGLSKSTDLIDATYQYQASKMSEYQAVFELRQTVYQQLKARGILETNIIEQILN